MSARLAKLAFLSAALLVALLAPLAAAANDFSETVMLVAKRQLHDRIYGRTILIARPIGNDQHIGFIVNRPTRVTLAQLFPDHRPSKKVLDPVFLGGPVSAESIFALVRSDSNPGGRSVRLTGDLYAVFESRLVDYVIENEPDNARFVAGLVAWRSGELREEVKRGAWFVVDADPALALRKPDGLWEELVRSAEIRAHGI